MENIFNAVIFYIDSSCEANLKKEVDRAIQEPTMSVRTNDDEGHLDRISICIAFSSLNYNVYDYTGNGRFLPTTEYFTDLIRRVEMDNIKVLSIASHIPEYPCDLVEEINEVHETNEVEVTAIDNFLGNSDDDGLVCGETARVVNQNMVVIGS